MLLRRRAKVLLTTGTVTSQALLDQRLPEQGLTGNVLHRFAPLDVPSWVDRFLSHWQPDAACFVESELWPNQLAACQARGHQADAVECSDVRSQFRTLAPRAGVCAAGAGRLQPSAGAWRRGRRSAARAWGAARRQPGRPEICRSATCRWIQVELGRLTDVVNGRPVWLAASTHPGEEALIAAVHRRGGAAPSRPADHHRAATSGSGYRPWPPN